MSCGYNELISFIQGIWTGIGIVAFAGLVVYATLVSNKDKK